MGRVQAQTAKTQAEADATRMGAGAAVDEVTGLRGRVRHLETQLNRRLGVADGFEGGEDAAAGAVAPGPGGGGGGPPVFGPAAQGFAPSPATQPANAGQGGVAVSEDEAELMAQETAQDRRMGQGGRAGLRAMPMSMAKHLASKFPATRRRPRRRPGGWATTRTTWSNPVL